MDDDRQKQAYIIDIEGDQGLVEVERLKRQGFLLTKALPLLPEGFVSRRGPDVLSMRRGRVVDLASGAGEWCLRVAQKLGEGVEVIGVDLNQSAIDFCNDLAVANERNNLEFRNMNVLEPLAFDDESCDLVNARLIVGILPIESWPAFIAECYRILKPGGMLRLVESGPTTIDGCPIQHEMNAIVMRALYKAGKTFSEYEYGVASALNRMLRHSDFSQVEMASYILDYSKWAPLHEPLTQDFMLSVRMLKPFLLRFGGIDEAEYDRLYAGCVEENENPEYSAIWNMVAIQARKPAWYDK